MITRAEINNILKKENLSFKKTIRVSDRFLLLLGSGREGDFVLKILRNYYRKFAKSALLKETTALKFFSGLKNQGLNVPRLFKENFEGKFPYYKEEFVSGKILEAKETFFFKKISFENLEKIKKILIVLNKTSLKDLKEKVANLSDFGIGYFDFAMKFRKKEIKKFLDKEQEIIFLSLIEKSKNIINSGIVSVVHGEVYPNNLMEDKNGRIVLLDLENIGIGNPAHDIAAVYLRLKRKSLSEILISGTDFCDKEPYKTLFKTEIILQTLGSLAYFESNKKFSKPMKANGQKYFIDIIKNFLK